MSRAQKSGGPSWSAWFVSPTDTQGHGDGSGAVVIRRQSKPDLHHRKVVLWFEACDGAHCFGLKLIKQPREDLKTLRVELEGLVALPGAV